MTGLTKEQERLLAQLGELVADCIRIGVEQERERCAKLATDAKYDDETGRDESAWNSACEHVADGIRGQLP